MKQIEVSVKDADRDYSRSLLAVKISSEIKEPDGMGVP